ncbi:MAG: RNHCP domain-containing protein [Pseudomonadota bacterium]
MALKTKRFRVVNEGFVCGKCGREVPPTSGATPRNHCPFCLWCMHVDINPGDRANPCRGMMSPIGIYTHTKKSYVVLHQCQRCFARVKAKAILADGNAEDDFDRILELSGNPIEETP